MYYHLIIETKEKKANGNSEYEYLLDLTDFSLIDSAVLSYIEGNPIRVKGVIIQRSQISRIEVKKSMRTAEHEARLLTQKKSPALMIGRFLPHNAAQRMDDITNEVFTRLESQRK
jgi:hypothetical protein